MKTGRALKSSLVKWLEFTADVALPRKGMLRGTTSESAESRPRGLRGDVIVPPIFSNKPNLSVFCLTFDVLLTFQLVSQPRQALNAERSTATDAKTDAARRRHLDELHKRSAKRRRHGHQRKLKRIKERKGSLKRCSLWNNDVPCGMWYSKLQGSYVDIPQDGDLVSRGSLANYLPLTSEVKTTMFDK